MHTLICYLNIKVVNLECYVIGEHFLSRPYTCTVYDIIAILQ